MVGINFIIDNVQQAFKAIIKVIEDVVNAIGSFFLQLLKAIEDLIARPDRTVPTRHSRFDEVQGKRLDDPAMGYAARDGAYVVRNERTGGVVQVSDKRQPGWKAPW